MRTKKHIENLFAHINWRYIYLQRQGKYPTQYEQGIFSTLRWIIENGPDPQHSFNMSECPPSMVLDQDIGKLDKVAQ